jgi:cysteine desulfurase
MSVQSMIYLDNAATTIMPPDVIATLNKWINKGNPSASYKSAEECRKLMKEFREYIAAKCNIISWEEDDCKNSEPSPAHYNIIFTSGASESNNMIIRSVTRSYKFHMKKIPHIITSAVEHKSVIDCVKQLEHLGDIELSIVKPNKLGFIEPNEVASCIKSNTALITIMSANNETGAIMNIKKIGELAHKHRVPFHTDAVQSFGKFVLDPISFNIDAFSVSFHKMHGPPGVGLLVIKQAFIKGFYLVPEICGSQNCGLRGGTENISGIAASYAGLSHTWSSRVTKNDKLVELKRRIIERLTQKITCQTYREYLEHPMAQTIGIVFISTAERTYLPGTLLLAIIKRDDPPMCNGKIKKALEKHGIIVSIGSACNTANKSASHVLTEMNVDEYVRRGALRITLDDINTTQEIDKFVLTLLYCIKFVEL